MITTERSGRNRATIANAGKLALIAMSLIAAAVSSVLFFYLVGVLAAPSTVTSGAGDWCGWVYDNAPELRDRDLLKAGVVMGVVSASAIAGVGILVDRSVAGLGVAQRRLFIGASALVTSLVVLVLISYQITIIASTRC